MIATRQVGSIPAINTKTPIERMDPVRVALFGVAGYLVIFLLSPVKVVTPQSLLPYLYICLGYLSFFMGCTLAKDSAPIRYQNTREALSNDQLLKIHRYVTTAALIGAALKIIDVFGIRGVSLAGSVVDRRNELDTVGSNPVSIVCAIVLPACLLVPFTYRLLQERGLGSRARWVFAHLLFLVPILTSAIVAGSRSLILIYVGIYFLYLGYFGQLRIKPKVIALVGLGALLLLAITTAIFNSRLQAMNLSPLDSVYTSSYAVTVQPQSWIGMILAHNTGLIGNTVFAYLLFCQYYVHGVFEFVYQYAQAPPIRLYGVASFNAFYKIVAFAFHLPGPEELYSRVTPHTGIYTTFFGPVYSDFGWFGMVYMTGLGALAQRLWQNCKAGSIAAVPFYMYLVIVIYCFPVVNFIVSSLGLYNLSVCALFFWLVPKNAALAASARPAQLRSRFDAL